MTTESLSSGLTGRHTGAGMVDGAIEIFQICAHAWAAAHHYEELKRLSDADLAQRGLKRPDLPRAAFRALTEHAPVPGHDDLRNAIG